MGAAASDETPAALREGTYRSDGASQQSSKSIVENTKAAMVDPKGAVENVASGLGLQTADSKGKPWNTHNLGRRLGVDAMCGAAAGGLVAPIIAIVDKAIMENASGKRPMLESFKASFYKLVVRPDQFLLSRPFRLIWMLYGGTYLVANTHDTVRSTIANKSASTTTKGFSKFVATSLANTGGSLLKDSQFTKMFGTVSPRPIPPISYLLFATRDSLTIFASFNLPPILAPSLPEATERFFTRTSAAQFIAPAAIQFVSTPLHLLGLDMYNRNGDTTMADRMKKVRLDWLKSSFARMARIVPAFGVGGVVNNGLRKKLMGELE